MSHIPVMLEESLALFRGKKMTHFFDGTLGAGGFAEAFLREHPETECYLGCDRDEQALALASTRLKGFASVFQPVHANFS